MKSILIKLRLIFTPLIGFITFFSFFLFLAVFVFGGFVYRPLGLAVDTFLSPLAVFVVSGLLCWRLRSFTKIWTNPWYYLWAILIVYNALIIPVVLYKYYSFGFGNAHDLALHHQGLWYTCRGQWLRSDIINWYMPFENWNLLKDHYYFIILLLAPFYYLFQEASFLLVAQAAAVSLAAVPIFLLASRVLKNSWWALLTALLYLFYPLVLGLPFSESRFEYYAIPLILFAFYFKQRERIILVLVLLFLAGLCKEDVYLAVASVGVYLLLFPRQARGYRWLGLVIAVVSLGLFLCLVVFIPRLRGYGYINSKIIEDAQTFIVNPALILTPVKINYFFNLFRYLWFVPLFSPLILLALPFLAINLLIDDVAVIMHIWHAALIVPFLFISFIYGLRYLRKKFPAARAGICIWFIFCSLFYYGGREFDARVVSKLIKRNIFSCPQPALYQEYRKVQCLLPDESSVFTQFQLLPNLSNRPNIFWYNNICSAGEGAFPADVKADYLFYSPSLWLRDKKMLDQDGFLRAEKILWDELLAGGRYKEIFRSNNFVLMARK